MESQTSRMHRSPAKSGLLVAALLLASTGLNGCTEDQAMPEDDIDTGIVADTSNFDTGTNDGDVHEDIEVFVIPSDKECLRAVPGAPCEPNGLPCGTASTECCCGYCTPSRGCLCEDGVFICGLYADRCLIPDCGDGQ